MSGLTPDCCKKLAALGERMKDARAEVESCISIDSVEVTTEMQRQMLIANMRWDINQLEYDRNTWRVRAWAAVGLLMAELIAHVAGVI